MLRSITGRQRLIPGLEAVVLEGGKAVVMWTPTEQWLVDETICDALLRCDIVTFQADVGVEVGRYSDDFSDALVDMAASGNTTARYLCRQRLTRPTISFTQPPGSPQ